MFTRFGQQNPPCTPQYPARLLYANDVDRNGTVKLGILTDMIDSAGARAADQMCPPDIPMATIALDRLEFGPLPRAFDFVTSQARITATGNRSVEVEVVLNTQTNKGEGSPKTQVAKGYLTFVTIDPGKTPVMAHQPQTPDEQGRAKAAQIRRTFRQQEQQQIAAISRAGNPPVTPRDVHPRNVVVYQTSKADRNRNGKVFGGRILDIMHRAGSKAAGRFARAPVTVLRQDRMQFEKPGEVGDRLIALPVVTRSWDDGQMEVQVDLLAQPGSWKQRLLWWFPPLRLNGAHRIATTFITYKPLSLLHRMPIYQATSPLEAIRWEAAGIRRNNRKLEQQALFSQVPINP